MIAVICIVKTNLDLFRLTLLLILCPSYVLITSMSFSPVWLLCTFCLNSFFPLFLCFSHLLSCALPCLDLISTTQRTKPVCLLISHLLSSHSFTPISMSPLLLTHFYYNHRSLPLALWPPLCRSFCLAVYEQSVWLAQTHIGGEWIKRLEGIFWKIAIYRLVRILEASNVESGPALSFPPLQRQITSQ